MATYGYLMHHGIKGQKWGIKNGPPYPLDYEDHNAAERKANPKASISKYVNSNKTIKDKTNLIRSARNYVGTKTGHYGRNDYNTNLPKNDADAKKKGWRKLSSKESAMHQFNRSDGVENSKWVSPDGHKEVVFTGKGKNQRITKDSRDIGTYNFKDPTNNPLAHTVYDVLPYIILGNTADDPTTAYGRVAESIKAFLKKSPKELEFKDKGKAQVVSQAIIEKHKNKTVNEFLAESKQRRAEVKDWRKQAKEEYKSAKKELKRARNEYKISKSWATNKALLDYRNTDDPKAKRKAKLKVKVMDKAAKGAALGIAKKASGAALAYGGKAVLNYLLPPSRLITR